MNVGIIGAGFAGCASALALVRNGHRVTLLEAVEKPMPIGAGIMLQPSGMLALARLGVLEKVLEHGERCDRLRCVRSDGRLVFDLPYAIRDPQLFGLGLHRGALFSALYDALIPQGVELRLGVQATHIEGNFVRDAAGHQHGPFDLIVVADGARSRVRAALGHAQRDQEYPWGALWCVVRDPQRQFRGELFQAVEGARNMMGLLPTGTFPGDPIPRVSLFFSVKLSEMAVLRARGFDAWKDAARALTSVCEPVLAQLSSFDDLLVATYRDVRMTRLHYGHIAYVGDSAHAMSPQLGQGSNLALLDALALADAVRDHPQLSDALPAYSRARRSQLAYYQLVNRALTPFFQGSSSVLGWARDTFMPLMARMPLMRGLMVATMCGIKQGFVRRSLPIAAARLALPEQASSTP